MARATLSRAALVAARLLVVGLVASVPLAIGGCGDSERSPSQQAKRTLARAVELTRSERTARMRASVRTAPEAKIAWKTSGLIALNRARSKGTMTFVDVPDIPSGSRVEFVMRGQTLYLKVPREQRWVVVPEDDPTFNTGVNDVLRYMSAIAGKVRPEGTERVRGVRTTVYRATVDLKKFTEQLPSSQRGAFEARTRVLGERYLQTRLWVDAKPRVRRVQWNLTPPPGVNLPEGVARFIISTEFYDFGVRADLSLPPRRQIDERGLGG